ncbi:hypothetical protein SEA_ABBYDAISY_93 [Arthrobacter phage AbbyDaisy]|nr:hypothetical protein SEA_ABBYDAISY_93 [Arthrobacter phage AbbyDaisy]
MSEQPYDKGGFIPQGVSQVVNLTGKPERILSGQVFLAPKGTVRLLGPEGWVMAGELMDYTFDENGGPKIPTPTWETQSITFEQIPPRTRREKRQRNAFMRLIYGGPLHKPIKRRQLIHNGRKP